MTDKTKETFKAKIRQPIVSLLGHLRRQKPFCSYSFQSIIVGKCY